MDGRREKVVCHLHIGGDLKKEMKQEYWWVGLYTWQRAKGQELSLGGQHRGKYVGRRNHYCIWHENSERKDRTWTRLVQCHEDPMTEVLKAPREVGVGGRVLGQGPPQKMLQLSVSKWWVFVHYEVLITLLSEENKKLCCRKKAARCFVSA